MTFVKIVAILRPTPPVYPPSAPPASIRPSSTDGSSSLDVSSSDGVAVDVVPSETSRKLDEAAGLHGLPRALRVPTKRPESCMSVCHAACAKPASLRRCTRRAAKRCCTLSRACRAVALAAGRVPRASASARGTRSSSKASRRLGRAVEQPLQGLGSSSFRSAGLEIDGDFISPTGFGISVARR